MLYSADGGEKLQKTTAYLNQIIGLPAAAMVLTFIFVSCSGTKPQSPPTAEGRFRQGIVYFDRGKLDKARHMFESLIFDFPGAGVADSAQYLVATCYYRQKEYQLAAAEYQRFYSQYPTSPLVDDAELMRSRSYFNGTPKNIGLDQQHMETCVDMILAFKDDHPSSPLLPTADSLLQECWARLSKKDFEAGKLYYRLRAYRAAQLYFQMLIDQFPESPLIPEAIYLIGESYRGLEIHDTAIVWYEKLIYLYPEAPITPKAKKRVAKLHSLPAAPSPPTKDD